MVEITWVDSVAVSLGWDDEDAYLEHMSPAMMQQKTCGYLVRETDDALMVALSRSAFDDPVGYGHINTAMLIPRSAVVEVVDLKAKKRATVK
jgi:hypothetical protein